MSKSTEASEPSSERETIRHPRYREFQTMVRQEIIDTTSGIGVTPAQVVEEQLEEAFFQFRSDVLERRKPKPTPLEFAAYCDDRVIWEGDKVIGVVRTLQDGTVEAARFEPIEPGVVITRHEQPVPDGAEAPENAPAASATEAPRAQSRPTAMNGQDPPKPLLRQILTVCPPSDDPFPVTVEIIALAESEERTADTSDLPELAQGGWIRHMLGPVSLFLRTIG
jgi:hypothetical protein